MSVRARRAARTVAALIVLLGAARAAAQRTDSSRTGVEPAPRGDTIPLPAPLTQAPPQPPVSPTNALLRSLVVPGWGQSSLDRGTSGAIFVGIEAVSVAMLMQSKAQLHAAQRVANDSVWDPATSAYLPHPLQSVLGSREQAVEDWTVLIIFNHLISAADAFVAAHLWNVPIEVRGAPTHKQATISAHLSW